MTKINVNSIVFYYVLSSILFSLIIISYNYQSHPDFLNFNDNPERKIIHPNAIEITKIKAISDLYQIKYSGIENAKEEFNLLYEMQMLIINAEINGILDFENGVYSYTSKASSSEKNRLDNELNKRLKRISSKEFSGSELVFNSTNYENQNISTKPFFNLKFDRGFDSLMKIQSNFSVSILNFKSFFGLLNKEEVNYLKKINASYSSIPFYLNNKLSNIKNHSFTTKFINELASLVLGKENAFSHGFISNKDFAIYQDQILMEFQKENSYYSVPTKTKNIIKQTIVEEKSISAILAMIIYYSTVIGMTYIIIFRIKGRLMR